MRYTKHRVRGPVDRVKLIEQKVIESVHGPGIGRLRQLLVQEVLPGTMDRDLVGQARAIFHWVKTHERYIYDPIGLDFYPTALVLHAIGGGDCDDHTIMVAAFLGAIGIDVGCRVIETLDGEWHIYPLALLNDEWVPLDTTWPYATDMGQEYPPSATKYRRAFLFEL